MKTTHSEVTAVKRLISKVDTSNSTASCPETSNRYFNYVLLLGSASLFS